MGMTPQERAKRLGDIYGKAERAPTFEDGYREWVKGVNELFMELRYGAYGDIVTSHRPE
jgi:hypothetical protein